MSKLKKFFKPVKGIHWPTKKQILADTIFTMVVAGGLTGLIFVWTRCLEEIVAWAANWF